MRRVTIRDVAAEAGVSIGTASKALNGQGKLRTETRERVAEAAQRLGFAPNTLAQALLAGRSFTVGLITTDSLDRKSTRLNSSHVAISYAVFCLKKKKKNTNIY